MTRKETASSYARRLVREFEDAIVADCTYMYYSEMDKTTHVSRQRAKHRLQKYIGDLQEEINTLRGQ